LPLRHEKVQWERRQPEASSALIDLPRTLQLADAFPFNRPVCRSDSVDLETAACSTQVQRVFPLQIQVTPTNQMLAVSFRAIMQIDRDTGEVVMISK
jgi:hypothetical protein